MTTLAQLSGSDDKDLEYGAHLFDSAANNAIRRVVG